MAIPIAQQGKLRHGAVTCLGSHHREYRLLGFPHDGAPSPCVPVYWVTLHTRLTSKDPYSYSAFSWLTCLVFTTVYSWNNR